jgi:hypothetical protein
MNRPPDFVVAEHGRQLAQARLHQSTEAQFDSTDTNLRTIERLEAWFRERGIDEPPA